MDENQGQYYSQRGPQFNAFHGSGRSSRPSTRAPFHSRSDFHQRGKAGGFYTPMMPQSEFAPPPLPPSSYYPDVPRSGSGRGIRKQSTINHTINSCGPRAGTQIAGCSAPIIDYNYPVVNFRDMNSSPVAPQQSYCLIQNQNQFGMMPPQGHLPQPPLPWNRPMGQYMYNPNSFFNTMVPLTCGTQPQGSPSWPIKGVQIYYDPRQGYFSNGSAIPTSDVPKSSLLNAEAPAYICQSVTGENMPENGETQRTDPNTVDVVDIIGQQGWTIDPDSIDVNSSPNSIFAPSSQLFIVEPKENPQHHIAIEISEEMNTCENQEKENINYNFVNATTDIQHTFIDKLQLPNISPPQVIHENMDPKKVDSKIKSLEINTLINTIKTNVVEEKRTTSQHDRCSTRYKSHSKENIPCNLEQQPPHKDDYEGHHSPPRAMLDFEQMNREAEEYRRAELAKLAPIVKDVYVEDHNVAQMNEKEVNEFREFKHNIKVSYLSVEELSVLRPSMQDADERTCIPIPNPVATFEQCFRRYPEIMEQILRQGFSLPTPIQCQLWPCIMRGLDVVGIAQTGSGKTLAFLLPALIHIERQHMPRSQRNSPTVLILAPTRELAQQIDKEVKKYSYKNIRSVCVYGGGSRADQIEAVSLQTEIIIATPGRLNDLVQAEKLNLKEVSLLILDEADEMLDQGFEPQINKALLKVRGDRQTILTSATWPASVRRMAYNYTKNPVMVVVGTTELRAVTTVKQNIVFIEEEDKFNWLIEFCRTMAPLDKAIIFVGKKALADHISSEFSLKQINCQCIHGALSQCDREQAIADMQSGAVRIMVATDVAARGIDIDNVTHIINHDFPRSAEQYVHRIGRTGRAGRTGESHTFISRRDWSSAEQLIEILQHAQQEIPQELIDMAERFKNRRDSGGGRGGRGGRGRNNWRDQQGGGNFGNRNQSGGDFGGDRRGGRNFY